MTLQQFIDTYSGKYIDEDGYYGSQCWDVSARYAREVVGCPSFPTGSGGAEGLFRIFANPIPQYFDRIANDKNDPNQLPKPGDVIVWNKNFSAPWGHTAVCISANSGGVTVLEQNGGNDPNGDGRADGVAYIKTRGWTNIDGWLRPKKGNSMATIPDADNWYWRFRKLMQQVRGRDMTREEFQKNFVGVEPFRMVEIVSDSDEADRATANQELGQLARSNNWQGQIDDLTARFVASEQALRNREQQADALNIRIGELESTVGQLTTQLDELVKVNNIKDGEIKRLQDENAKLAAQVGDVNFGVKQAIRVLWQTILDAVKQK